MSEVQAELIIKQIVSITLMGFIVARLIRKGVWNETILHYDITMYDKSETM